MPKKQSKKREKYNYTLDGQRLFSIFSQRTTDGAILGFTDPKIGNVHLTMAEENGRVFWHITNGRETEKVKKYPFAGHLPKEEFEKRIAETINKHTKKYHGNKCAYIMTEQLKSRIRNEIIKRGANSSTLPLEFMSMFVKCNFEDKNRWIKIRIKDMVPNKIYTAYIIENHIVKLVYPLPLNKALFASQKQLINILDKLNRLLGVEEYLKYINPDIKKDLEKRIKKIRKKGN